jgi:hypothetical protein
MFNSVVLVTKVFPASRPGIPAHNYTQNDMHQNDIWQNGICQNGIWHDGIWQNGIWQNDTRYRTPITKPFLLSVVLPSVVLLNAVAPPIIPRLLKIT